MPHWPSAHCRYRHSTVVSGPRLKLVARQRRRGRHAVLCEGDWRKWLSRDRVDLTEAAAVTAEVSDQAVSQRDTFPSRRSPVGGAAVVVVESPAWCRRAPRAADFGCTTAAAVHLDVYWEVLSATWPPSRGRTACSQTVLPSVAGRRRSIQAATSVKGRERRRSAGGRSRRW